MSRGKYKEIHLDYLREISDGKSNKEITKLFNDKFKMEVTESAIQTVRTRNRITNNIIRHQNQFSKEEEEYVEQIALGRSNREITEMLNDKFDKDRSVSSIVSLKHRRRILSFPNKGRKYKPEEIEYLKAISEGRSNREITKLFNQKFSDARTEDSISSIRYENGMVNRIKTQFEKGNKPVNWVPVGSERVTADGYTQVKVRDGHNHDNWKGKHIIMWEEEHGAIPDGSVVIFGDGDRTNLDISNLICVDRGKLAQLNKQDLIQSDAELTRTAVNILELQSKISERSREG